MSGYAASSYITTATVATVAASATAVTLLASNQLAKMRAVYNDSTVTLYLKYGATATSSDYTVQIPANGHYEFPTYPIYAGLVTGAWASATGNARTTEG